MTDAAQSPKLTVPPTPMVSLKEDGKVEIISAPTPGDSSSNSSNSSSNSGTQTSPSVADMAASVANALPQIAGMKNALPPDSPSTSTGITTPIVLEDPDQQIPPEILASITGGVSLKNATPSIDKDTSLGVSVSVPPSMPPVAGNSPVSSSAIPNMSETPTVATPVIPPLPTSSPTAALTGDVPDSPAKALVEQGSLTQQQYDALVIEQAQTGKTLDTLIKEQKLVSETAWTKAQAKFYNIPFIELNDIGVSPEAISQLPEAVARRYHLLPFLVNKQERTLSVAMENPLDLEAIDFTEKKTGFKIQPFFATTSEIERMINERYAQNLTSEVNAALKETKSTNQDRNINNLAALSKEVIREAPITKIVETILGFAMKSRASDVHIEPQEDRSRVRYRIDGILNEKLILPKTVHDSVVSRIKILSDLKIDEKRLPQDGRFTFSAEGEEVDLRVSTLPIAYGEKVVMRLLKKNSSVPSLSELGFTGQALRDVEESIKTPHGIVLVTGPTGSGKTTTLYSVLHQINTPKVNIMTLEDPVEYQMAGINQVQINPQIGLTFANGLRAFLRQDPNIIMVGEIRDKETAELAIQASLTGHLVFSTLHTNSAAGAIPRLIDMEAEPFLLASSLTLTMAQRVVRKINPAFKEEYTPDDVLAKDVKNVLGPLYPAWCKQNNKDPEKLILFRAKQERPETEPEYKGRMAIFEVMKITEEIGKLILERKTAADIERVALKNGMHLMKQDGYLKALDGITTIEEVLRVAEV
jgi:type IV pilus assembly protein PilB